MASWCFSIESVALRKTNLRGMLSGPKILKNSEFSSPDSSVCLKSRCPIHAYKSFTWPRPGHQDFKFQNLLSPNGELLKWVCDMISESKTHFESSTLGELENSSKWFEFILHELSLAALQPELCQVLSDIRFETR
jgi:hypothetical protein